MSNAAKEWVQVRVTADEKKRVDRILATVRKKAPILTNAQLIRAALREGLSVLESHPEQALLGSAQ